MDYPEELLTGSLASQFFPGCHPRVGFSFAEVSAAWLSAVMPMYG